MKTLTLLFFMKALIITSHAQVVSNVKWELEGNERINITYDLARQDSYIYFDVSVKITIDNETITAKALSGDIGNFIKVGTNKKIVWNIFEDLTELNGELSVEVIAFNPVPSPSPVKVKQGESPSVNAGPKLPAEKNIPFWIGMGSVGATGIGLLMTGLKNSAEGKDLYGIYKDNRVEGADIYDELGASREDVYSEANKKYKNGTLVAMAGGAILAAAGVIMVKRIIELKKIDQRGLAFLPYIHVSPQYCHNRNRVSTAGGLTIRFRLN